MSPVRRWTCQNRQQRILSDFHAQPLPLAFSASTAAPESRPTRRFHRFSVMWGAMPDCVAEGSEFELPVPVYLNCQTTSYYNLRRSDEFPSGSGTSWRFGVCRNV